MTIDAWMKIGLFAVWCGGFGLVLLPWMENNSAKWSGGQWAGWVLTCSALVAAVAGLGTVVKGPGPIGHYIQMAESGLIFELGLGITIGLVVRSFMASVRGRG